MDSKSVEDLRRLRTEGVITEEEFLRAQERLRTGAAAPSPSASVSQPTLWHRLWWNPNPSGQPRLDVRRLTNGGEKTEFGAAIDRFTKAVFRLLQWGVAAVALIITLSVAFDFHRVYLPGASPELFWGALAVGAVCMLLLTPPVFFRTPFKLRLAPYALLVSFFFVADRETTIAANAYARTPEGAKAAAEEGARRRAAEARAAADYEREQQAEASAAAETRGNANREKAQACLSSGNRLPALEDAVKNSLHNPDSFQFVDITLATVKEHEASLYMSFRGENGFGAIRTGSVRAELNTDDCSVTDIGEPEVE